MTWADEERLPPSACDESAQQPSRVVVPAENVIIVEDVHKVGYEVISEAMEA